MIDVAEVRAARRVEPRVGVAIAGAGVVIAIGGAIGLASDQTGSAGDPNRVPGIVVSLALIAAGVALVRRFRTGAFALAGSVAAAVGVPALLVFATLTDEGFPGFDLAATLLVSALGWAVLHVVCDRRLLFLAASLVALPLFVMEATEEVSNVPELIGYGFSSAFTGYDDSYLYEYTDADDDGYDDFSGLSEADHEEYMGDVQASIDGSERPPEAPDPTVLGVIALLFAALYVVTGRTLSDRGSLGAGTPPTVVGALLAALGVALLADDIEEIGTGIALIGIGGALLWVGVAAGRRFTTWWGALLLAAGIVTLIDRALGVDADAAGASTVSLVIGAAIVIAGHVIGERLGEAPEEGVDAEAAPLDPGPPPVHEIVLEEE